MMEVPPGKLPDEDVMRKVVRIYFVALGILVLVLIGTIWLAKHING